MFQFAGLQPVQAATTRSILRQEQDGVLPGATAAQQDAAAATSAPETTAPQTGEIFRDVPQTASLLTPKPAIDPEVKPDTTAEVKPAGVVAEESGEVVDDEDAVVIADYESLYEGSEEAAVDGADMTGEKGSEGGEKKPSQEEEELDRSLSDVEKLLLDDNESTNSRDEEQEHGSRIQNEEARTESQAGEGVDAVVAAVAASSDSEQQQPDKPSQSDQEEHEREKREAGEEVGPPVRLNPRHHLKQAAADEPLHVVSADSADIVQSSGSDEVVDAPGKQNDDGETIPGEGVDASGAATIQSGSTVTTGTDAAIPDLVLSDSTGIEFPNAKADESAETVTQYSVAVAESLGSTAAALVDNSAIESASVATESVSAVATESALSDPLAVSDENTASSLENHVQNVLDSVEPDPELERGTTAEQEFSVTTTVTTPDLVASVVREDSDTVTATTTAAPVTTAAPSDQDDDAAQIADSIPDLTGSQEEVLAEAEPPGKGEESGGFFSSWFAGDSSPPPPEEVTVPSPSMADQAAAEIKSDEPGDPARPGSFDLPSYSPACPLLVLGICLLAIWNHRECV